MFPAYNNKEDTREQNKDDEPPFQKGYIIKHI